MAGHGLSHADLFPGEFHVTGLRPSRPAVRTYSLLPGADQRIRDAVSDICISMKTEDYLTLPNFVEHIVPVALDASAKKAYQKLEREMLLQVDTETITAGSAAALNGKLLQLCGGTVYTNDGGVADVHTCQDRCLPGAD